VLSFAHLLGQFLRPQSSGRPAQHVEDGAWLDVADEAPSRPESFGVPMKRPGHAMGRIVVVHVFEHCSDEQLKPAVQAIGDHRALVAPWARGSARGPAMARRRGSEWLHRAMPACGAQPTLMPSPRLSQGRPP
jgi:hypothetical protein